MDADEVTKFITGALQWYRSEGIIEVRLRELQTEQLNTSLFSADAHWDAIDQDGQVSPSDHTRTILSHAEGCFTFRAAISLASF
jgi:hypothetical protein